MPGNKKNKRKPKSKRVAPTQGQTFQDSKGFDPKTVRDSKGGAHGTTFTPQLNRTKGSQRGR